MLDDESRIILEEISVKDIDGVFGFIVMKNKNGKKEYKSFDYNASISSEKCLV